MKPADSSPPSARPRSGSGALPDASFVKLRRKVVVISPLSWPAVKQVRIRLLAAVALAAAACASGLALVSAWHRTQLDDLAAQRQRLVAFTRSPEFGAFVRSVDDAFVTLHNLAALHPREAHALLSAVAEREHQLRLLPWTLSLTPLPSAAAIDPVRAARASRDWHALLAHRGFACDSADRAAARALFVQSLGTYFRAYRRRVPGDGFPALALDRSMQEIALAAYAARQAPHGSVALTERTFVLHRRLGPTLARHAERTRASNLGPTFATARAGL